MNLSQIIEKRFKENLELAREENPGIEDNVCWRFAREWTIEDMASEIAKYIDSRWANQQELINKVFYG